MSFNAIRLRIARTFHGWNQRELAEKVSVSHSAIAFYEKGLKSPKPEIRAALAVVLKVDPSFFERPDLEDFREDESHFRRRIAATERQRKQVLAHGSLFAEVARHLQREVRIVPRFALPEITPTSLADVDRVADDVRRHVGLPLDVPIGSVARILDNAGVLLLAVEMETAKRVDAFSRYGQTSVVVLNTEKESPSRTLFDEAHELGHGVMHRSGRTLTLDQREDEANRFAGALLLPREAFIRDMMGVRPDDWTYLFEMKRQWGASIKAILYRAYQLGMLDAAEYRKRMRYYSYRGWNGGEPEEPQRDQPTLFSRVFAAYCENTGTTASDIAVDLGWTEDLFTSVTGIPRAEAVAIGVIALDRYRGRGSARPA